MANKTRIIRSVEATPHNYTPLSNQLLQNNHLSLDTRGLLSYLVSLPTDWIVYKQNIQKQFGFGRKKMDRMWSEAKEFGYLQSEKFRENDGTWNYIYTISDVPLSTVPLSNVGSSNVGKGDTIQSKNKQSKNRQNKHNSNNLVLATKQIKVKKSKPIMSESEFDKIMW